MSGLSMDKPLKNKRRKSADQLSNDSQLVKNRFKSNLLKKFQCLFERTVKQGSKTLLNEIHTELYITESERGEINNEHEVRQIETQSRRAAAEETPIKRNDIFRLLPGQDKAIRTVLTKGVAGIGKTVSVQRFIVDWAEEKDNQDIQLIFPLPFRELNLMKDKTLSLLGLLGVLFPETKDVEISSDEYKVLFIFDGLDEFRLSLDFKDDRKLCDISESASVDQLLVNLIVGNLLPSALIWITSRPSAADLLPSEFVHRVTEVRGFTDPQKEEYFRKRIRDQSLAKTIISHLKSSRSLHIMCHIPVFCWISATVLKRMMREQWKGNIPKTLTQMYTQFLIIKTNIKHGKDNRTKVKVEKMILKLGKLAFQQFLNGNLIFYEEDLRECDIDVAEASVYSGLYTQIFREEHGLNQGKVFSFVHQSIQEHLAALYAHHSCTHDHIYMFGMSFKLLFNLHQSAVDEALQSKNGHLDLFLQFLLGLSLASNHTSLQDLLTEAGSCSYNKEETVQYVKQKIREIHSPERSINLFHCLNELGDDSLMKEIQDYLKSGRIGESKLSSLQWSALVYVLLTSEQEIDHFNLKQFTGAQNTADEVLQKLLPVVKKSKSVQLRYCGVTDKGCAALTSALTSNPEHLRELDLTGNEVGDNGVKLLSDLLKDPHCNLQILSDNSKLIHSMLISNLLKKFQCLYEGTALQGNPSLLNKIYTELYITESERGEINNEHEVRQIETQSKRAEAEETQIKCSDIFRPLPKQDKAIRTVLTKGVAGIGKTVSVQKFILDWAEGKDNQDVQLIFPLPFRELNLMKDKTLSLSDLLHIFFPETKEIKQFSIEYKVLFIFDGLDECRLSLDFQSELKLSDISESASVDDLLVNLIMGNLLPSALIWITSRPAAANLLPSEFVHRVTEVRGFTDPQKEEYFRKRIRDQSLADKIISHLKSSRSLHIMCHIPVFCWISATVLEKMMSGAETGEIPKTLTQMYTHFLILQRNTRQEKDYEKKVKDKHMILKLGKLAFRQLVNGNLIFYEEDLMGCGIDVTEASVYSGLCTQIFRAESGLKQRKVFSFVHLSIQEHLAALYAHLSFTNKNKNVFDQTKQGLFSKTVNRKIYISLSKLHQRAVDEASQSKNGHLDLFLRFLLGLSLESNQNLLQDLLTQTGSCSYNKEETVQYVKQKIKEICSPERSINLFHCLNELGDDSLMKEIQDYLRPGKIGETKLSSSQWSALVYVLLTSEQKMDVFDLKQFIGGQNTADEVLHKLLTVVKESRSVQLSKCGVTDEGCAALTSALRSNPQHLRELNLSWNKLLGDSGVKLLSDGLKDPYCKLEILRLRDCGITVEGCAALTSALTSNPEHLRELDLSLNNLGDSGVKLLSDLLKDPHCKLEKLWLRCCGVTDEGCAALTSALRSNPEHLRRLDLTGNKLGDSGVKLLSDLKDDPHYKLDTLYCKQSSNSLDPKSDRSIDEPEKIRGRCAPPDPSQDHSQRSNSPEPSYVSMKSDRSIDEPEEFEGRRTPDDLSQDHSQRSNSPEPSYVSMKSDRSIDEPEKFEGKRTPDDLSQDHSQRSNSAEPSCVFMKRKQSINEPQKFKGSITPDLRSNLLKKFQCLNEGTATQGNPSLLNEIYTELYITESEGGEINNEHEVRQIEKLSKRIETEETPIKCSDIFKPLPGQDKAIRTVLTKGVAGIGKTVSVQKFIVDWAEEKENQDVQLIFPLPFRELNLMKEETLSLLGLLHAIFPETKQMKISSYEYKVLFIFDGLDECRLSLNFKSDVKLHTISESASVGELLVNLIVGNLLPSALIWITSRPAAADLLPSEFVHRVTEVRGFTDPQKEEYFRKRIRDQSLADTIISHLKSSRSLHIMCHIPVFCWISATVLEEMMSGAETGEIPKTLTQMYTHFLIIQTNIRQEKDYEKKVKNEDVILKLGKLAFQQLVNGKIIFYEEDLRECGIDVTEASVYSGLCTQIFRAESGLNQWKVFSFVHLSVQEHLAALYAHYSFANNNINVFHQDKRNLTPKVINRKKYNSLSALHKKAVKKAFGSKNGHLDLFLRFLLGLSLESNQTLLRELLTQTGSCSYNKEETVQYIRQKIRENRSQERSINLFHCLNELGDDSLMQEIQDYLRSGGIKKTKLSSSQWSALVCVLLISEQKMDVFDLKQFIGAQNTADEVLQKLLPVVKESQSVQLRSCGVTYKGCAALTSALRSNPQQLRELDLTWNKLSNSGVKLLSDGLKDPHCKLEILRLRSCGVTHEGCAALTSALRSNPQHLKDLDLAGNKLVGDSGVKLLSDGLKDPYCKLEILRLRDCGVTDKGCADLTSALRSNPEHLRKLNLSYNELGDSGVKLLSGGLKNPHCKLEILSLKCCGVTGEGCAALTSALRSNPQHLRELDLSLNKLEDSGVKPLSDLKDDPHYKLKMLNF